MEIFNCDQNSAEWMLARCGIPTASAFKDILAKGEGKMRRTYMHKLAGEIITGQPAESFTNAHMERGHEMEGEARELYAFSNAIEPLRVGFVRNGPKGCSPDSLIGENGGLEIKTALPHIQVERILKDQLPPEHRAQVQGSLWVTEREFWDFVSYWPRMPLFTVRVYRDEAYIRELSEAVDAFNEELATVVERVRAYGAFDSGGEHGKAA